MNEEQLKESASQVMASGKETWNKMTNEGIFANPGAKIKKFAKILNMIGLVVTILGVIGWFIGGIAGGIAEYEFWLFLLLFIPIILNYGLVYLSCLFLYAFAEMVENSTKLVSMKQYELQMQPQVQPTIDMSQVENMVEDLFK